MADKPPLKLLSAHEWESLIDDFQYGGARRGKWTAAESIAASLVDQALSCLLKRDFPIKHSLILFLDEFSDFLFSDSDSRENCLQRLVETLRSLLQMPADGITVSLSLKEQVMVSVTSIIISTEAGLDQEFVRVLESLVESLLVVINRPNHSSDRQVRGIACECLRELEIAFPCLLSDVAGHLWSLCQSERTHASQSYILLFSSVIGNIVAEKVNVSLLNNSVPLVPFCASHSLLSRDGSAAGLNYNGLNYKELRRAMAFLLEWPHVMTPCGMMEFMRIIMPVALALELQASMLKVQFFGMIYSFDPMLIHVVLKMYSQFLDAFEGQEAEIARRLMLVSRETQQTLVFRLLARHWLLGFGQLVLRSGNGEKTRLFVEIGLKFYPSVFDSLALKALKLDVLAFCSVCMDVMNLESSMVGDKGTENSMVKLFRDGLVSVSAFKWLPAESTETAVAFRAFHKFLIGASSHSNSDPSTTRSLMDSSIFNTVQGMIVDVTLECQKLVSVIVALVDRLLSCQKHQWLGERLLQTFDQHLLSKVKIDYKLVSYFSLFDRIAENNTIPPRGLLELLSKFMVFLVEKQGPDTGLKSWSQGSKVLGICRTLLMHHQSSKLFLRLSRLLAFTCLYFPDLEVRDNARIYLRMLICVPGRKLRDMLNLGDQLLGISSTPSSSFFSVPSPRSIHNVKKPSNLSSCVHLERLKPLLVKQYWSLSLPLSIGTNNRGYFEDVKDSEPTVEEREIEGTSSIQIIPENIRVDKPPEPLRVMDSKISEILQRLRRHFSCIPDFRYMAGLKVKIPCGLRFASEPFNRILGVSLPAGGFNANVTDSLPAIYATVLKFSSSAPYGSIPSSHIPFLLGDPPPNTNPSGQGSLDIVPIENGSREDKSFRAPVTIELEPREPTPGLVEVLIETNAENGVIVRGQLHSVAIGIEDMFLKAIVPSDVKVDAIPCYCMDLFNALWEACGTTGNTGRETFSLKGGKGVAAISGTRSVKLLEEIPTTSLIQSVERHLAPFVVSVIGEPLCSLVKDGGIIRDVIWEDAGSNDDDNQRDDFERGPLHLTYSDDQGERDNVVNVGKRNLGCFLILIFLPPRFHLLFQMEVGEFSTLVRIRTDHWPCLAYIDDYLEALFLS